MNGYGDFLVFVGHYLDRSRQKLIAGLCWPGYGGVRENYLDLAIIAIIMIICLSRFSWLLGAKEIVFFFLQDPQNFFFINLGSLFQNFLL